MENSNRHYRSGLLMGLTMAETLLLILFLLLLIFSALFVLKEKETIERKNQLADLKEENSNLIETNQFLENIKNEISSRNGKDFDDIFKELQLSKSIAMENSRLKENQAKMIEFKSMLEEQVAKKTDEIKSLDKENKKLKNVIEEKDRLNEKFSNKNEDLIKQISRMVETQKGLGKGADYPPCWLDSNNKIEYLFNVVINDEGIIIYDIENSNRSEEKKELPISDLVYKKSISPERYLTVFKPLYDLCVNNNCRHFVKIFDHTTRKDTFKKNLLTVETYFYKYLSNEKL